MDAHRFVKVKEIYQAVLDLSPDARESYLHDSCGEDDELRKEINSLLAYENTFDSFIDTPPDAIAAELIFNRNENDLSGFDVGHYKIITKIGRGGMATVYRATDKLLERDVAVKFLHDTIGENPDRLYRFLSEAKAASSLNHPNIITVFEVGDYKGSNFLATEFIAGVTLRERLSQGQLEVDEVVNIAIQIASALDAAHKAGIIHRDIKPENAMIRPDGLVKVLDFGIAKIAGNDSDLLPAGPARFDTAPGTILGTTDYMSPEQVRSTRITAQTDIFSLGIVLYEMLSGSLPFAGHTRSDVMSAILLKEPSRIEREDIPVELLEIVSRALRKDESERYHSSAEMHKDLVQFQRDRDLDLAIGRTTQADASSQLNGGIFALSSRASLRAAAGLFLAFVLIGGLAIGYWYYSVANEGTIRSIAVMPFINNSDSVDNEYFSDGLTESLINSLSLDPNLSVKARSSVFSFKGKELDPQKIGSELSVESVLLGNVSQLGEQIIISLELVDTQTGDQIWGKRYQRDSTDLVAFHREISRDVAKKLGSRLSINQDHKSGKTYTEDPDAYRRYLKGRYFWNRRSSENLYKAIEEFRAAVDHDPNYALAYVGLSDAYVLLENFAGTPSSETLPIAKAYAERALEIDDQLPEAHASLALTLHRSWNWAEAEREYKGAIELNPNYATVHHSYSLYLRETGRLEDSLLPAKRAYELDPLSGIITGNLGVTYIALGEADAAVELMRKAVVFDPAFPFGHSILGLAYIKKGMHAEAISETQKGSELSRQSGNALATYGYALAAAGKRIEAIAVITELEQRYIEKTAIGQNIAAVYAGLGDNDQAFRWLVKDLETRSSFLPYIRWLPAFESLRDDPRFTDLCRRMGMAE